MKKQLTLETDKSKAKEGEYIEIRWDCPFCPDTLFLTFDSGYKKDTIVVSDNGSTRIATPKTKGRFQIKLIASVSGKKLTKETSLRVLNTRSDKQSAKSKLSKFKLWREKMHAGWCVFRAQMKYWWLSQKKWQKALWIALLALWLGLLIFSFSKSSDIDTTNSQTAYITDYR